MTISVKGSNYSDLIPPLFFRIKGQPSEMVFQVEGAISANTVKNVSTGVVGPITAITPCYPIFGEVTFSQS